MLEEFKAALGSGLTQIAGKLILALVVFLVGKWVVGKLTKVAGKSKAMEKLDPSMRSFTLSALKAVLYVVLVVTIVGIIGVPMASVVTVLASAGVAVGLALQGALSNLAGGIMIIVFRPFKVGDYVEAGGAEGTVKEITLFYTVITTLDNKRITVPNGSLMGANVTNYSTEDLRRVDLTFSCGKGEDPQRVQDVMLQTITRNPKVLQEPAPFARLSGATNEAMEFTTRAWCANADYWDVYFDLNQAITEALGEAGVNAPAIRVKSVE